MLWLSNIILTFAYKLLYKVDKLFLYSNNIMPKRLVCQQYNSVNGRLKMKGIYTTAIAVMFLCMVMFPLLAMEETVASLPEGAGQSNETSDNTGSVRLYITEKQTVERVPMKEYITGVVLAEMPAEYNEEALKAQAVAAYTFALRKKEARQNEDYDLTDSHKTDQAYLSVDAAKERFGENYNKYLQKVSAAIASVYGQMIVYEGEPIFAAYHSVSAGKTESAENIWGKAYPYLVPVESVGDTLSPNYLSVAEFGADEFKSAMEKASVSCEGEADKWLGEKVCSDSGTVLTMKICGTQVKGTDIRTALGLKSSVFEVEYSDGKFKFTVMGYGHCVGMSQYGAQFMASQGSKYDEILKWYYPGCSIVKT